MKEKTTTGLETRKTHTLWRKTRERKREDGEDEGSSIYIISI